MFRPMFLIATEKFVRQPMLRILLLSLAVAVVGIQLIMFGLDRLMPAGGPAEAAQAEMVAAQAREMVTWPGALVNALSMAGAGGLGAALIIVLVGAAVTQEYQWRTLHLWLSRGVPRLAYGLARFASVLLPALLLVLAGLLVGALASLPLHAAVTGAAPAGLAYAGELPMAVLRTTFTLLPYAALAYWLGVLTRSTAATIGIGLVVALLVENLTAQLLTLAGGWPARLATWMPVQLSATLVQRNALLAGVPVEPVGMAPGMAMLGLALYTLAFLGLALWRLQRQDLTA